MFDSLSSRLGDIFDSLTRQGALSEKDVDTALREVRRALLEADVALPVVKSFIDQVKPKAVGQDVLKSVSPGQMVIKIVNDQLAEMLGSEQSEINLNAAPPAVILMVGLQGSGKTTSTAKIARRLSQKDKKKVLMASLDVYRPAAMDQLKVLGEQVEVDVLPIVQGQMPVDIANRAMQAGKLKGYDVIMLDTAGRLSIDEALMQEVEAVKAATNPVEVLLVADAMTGQDAVQTAKAFKERTDVTGIVLTRIDGDGRGGAALSMRHVADVPIKMMGTGEAVDKMEDFHPERIASRILGMGDVVSFVEKAAETIEKDEAEKLAKKMAKGQFDMDDMKSQIQQLMKMGGLQGMMGMLPGIGKMKKQLAGANMDDGMLKQQIAIINSMTKKERKTPKLLNASRKRRIAEGSGTTVQDVNKVLKQYKTMADMMKKVRKMGKKGLLSGGLEGMLPPQFPMR